MNSLINTYNSQIPLGNIVSLQLHTDRHSECDLDDYRGEHRHSEYSEHTDQMWSDGEEE